MSVALLVVIAIVALVILIALFMWGLYNGLVRSRMQVRESWSGIDVQLKRRYSLIPNLVETVKGYAAHEREVFENVTKARAALMNAGDAKSAAEANNQLTSALKTLFAVAENYPQLRASENFPIPSTISDFPNVSPPPLVWTLTAADSPLLHVIVPSPLAVL